jgi:hypothetical protein
VDTADQRAQAMFGSAGRFRFLVWVAGLDPPEFYAAKFTTDTGVSFAAASLIVSLRQCGLVERIGTPMRPWLDTKGQQVRDPSGKPISFPEAPGAHWYTRIDHPVWQAITTVDAALGIVPAPTPARRNMDDVLAELAVIIRGLAT